MSKSEPNLKSESRSGNNSRGGFVSLCRFGLLPFVFSAMCSGSFAAIISAPVTFPTYPENVITFGPLATIDYNQDGLADLSFGIPPAIGHEWGARMTMYSRGSSNAQFIVMNGESIPLRVGDTVGMSLQAGEWQSADFAASVWSHSWGSYQAGGTFMATATNLMLPVIGLGGIPINGFPSSTNPLPPSPEPLWISYNELSGVGIGDAGEFMGVRFEEADGWHYGWVRFGTGGGNPIEFAYETSPNTVLTIVPEPRAWLLLVVAFVVVWCSGLRRRSGNAEEVAS